MHVTPDKYASIDHWLRQLPRSRQVALAISLASLVEPLASLSSVNQPLGGLGAVAFRIREADSDVAVDRARHVLWSIPALAEEEEPDGIDWFVLRACVAWIYAADCKSTAPADGVAHAFRCVLDIVNAIDDVLQDTDLAEQLTEEFEHGASDVDRLRPQVASATVRISHNNYGF